MNNIDSIIKTYKNMRNTFDNNHCYIAEIQYTNSKEIYALQLHRTHYQQKPNFEIDRELEK
jgi:hypothetical protein